MQNIFFVLGCLFMYLAWYCIMDSPIPYSMNAQKLNGFLHGLFLCLSIFSFIVFMLWKKICFTIKKVIKKRNNHEK
jgi:uncharacterized membrane protein